MSDVAREFCQRWALRINDPKLIHELCEERFPGTLPLRTVERIVGKAYETEAPATVWVQTSNTVSTDGNDGAEKYLPRFKVDPLHAAIWREHPAIMQNLASRGLNVVHP